MSTFEPRDTPAEVAAAPSEDTERLREVVRRYFPDVWRFLRRLGFAPHIVDDAAQELFLVTVRRLETIDPSRVRPFLLGTALRIARTQNRRHAREVPTEQIDILHNAIDGGPTPEQDLDDGKARELAYQLLSQLQEDTRVVFVMHEIEGLTMNEISQATGAPLGTVASRLRRGREEIQARLERHRARIRSSR